MTEDHKKHWMEKMKGKTYPQRRKSVINLETGQIYDSIMDAEKSTGIKHISSCANGKRKSAGGFHWAYLK